MSCYEQCTPNCCNQHVVTKFVNNYSHNWSQNNHYHVRNTNQTSRFLMYKIVPFIKVNRNQHNITHRSILLKHTRQTVQPKARSKLFNISKFELRLFDNFFFYGFLISTDFNPSSLDFIELFLSFGVNEYNYYH